MPSGGVALVEGGGAVHVPLAQSRPPKQSALVAQVPPTSVVPSGAHTAESPWTSHRRPGPQSASLPQAAPLAPVPAGAHVRDGPQ
jgi:hypothetical protein